MKPFSLAKAHAENIKKQEESEQNLKRYEEEHPEKLELLRTVSEAHNYKETKAVEERQIKKMENLTRYSTKQEASKPANAIHNLSSRILNKIEEEALRYGMNMCWPQTPRELEVKAETEILYQKSKGRRLYRKAMLKTSNTSSEAL